MRHFVNILLMVISFAASLAVAEAFFAWIETPEEYQFAAQVNAFEKYSDPIYRYDPSLGWAQKAVIGAPIKKHEFQVWAYINSRGMRYREVPAKKGFRVAVLGDSFTFGMGVDVKYRFTNLLEKRLGVEVLNYGVMGYGPIHYYLMLDEVIKDRPDLVVLAFFFGNDFGDNVTNFRNNAYKPYAVLANESLVIRGQPAPNVHEAKQAPGWLLGLASGRFIYSHFYSYLQALWPSHFPFRTPVFDDEKLLFGNPMGKQLEEAARVNEALLRAIRKKLAQHHIPLLIYAIPVRPDASHDNSLALSLLRKSAQRVGVPLVENVTAFTRKDYYRLDSHWRKRGHEKAAAMLAPAISIYMPYWMPPQPAAVSRFNATSTGAGGAK